MNTKDKITVKLHPLPSIELSIGIAYNLILQSSTMGKGFKLRGESKKSDIQEDQRVCQKPNLKNKPSGTINLPQEYPEKTDASIEFLEKFAYFKTLYPRYFTEERHK